MRVLIAVGIAASLAGTQAKAQVPAGMSLHPAAKMEWKPAPPTLPKGTMVTVLEGDPTKAGLFTIRLKFPASTRVMPHFHAATEHATVMAGTLHIGHGDAFDKSALSPMPTGSFGYWPAGMHHFAWMEGETILQLHGEGPWVITYVNKADDPRNTP